jgi:hypothetical protein
MRASLDAAEQLSATLGERVLESIGDIEPRRRPFAVGVIHSAPRRDEGEAYRSLHVQPTSRVGACGNRGLWRTIADRAEAEGDGSREMRMLLETCGWRGA